MNAIVTLFLSLAISTAAFSQITFEKGYIIDHSNNRTECLIKNVDWRASPSVFVFKRSETASLEQGDVESVLEFGVAGGRYQTHQVRLDPNEIISESRSPIFRDTTVFLKVITDNGRAKLYKYSPYTFFYTTGDSVPVQLINRRYKAFSNDRQSQMIGKNEMYKQQLFNDLNCKGAKASDFNRISYSEPSLTKLFLNDNKCTDPSYVVPELADSKRNKFDLKLILGGNLLSSSAYNPYAGKQVFFPKKSAVTFGLGVEYFLPFNKNKWAVIFEPDYYYYQGNSVNPGGNDTAISLHSIELPVGIRYKSFINSNTIVFLNAMIVLDCPLDFRFKYNDWIRPFAGETNLSLNGAVGVGVSFGKVSLEGRYYTTRTYMFWDAHVEKMSLLAGFRLF